jgi:hypothetical protein
MYYIFIYGLQNKAYGWGKYPLEPGVCGKIMLKLINTQNWKAETMFFGSGKDKVAGILKTIKNELLRSIKCGQHLV